MFMKERLGNYIQEYSVRNKNGEDIPVYSVTNTQGFCKDYFGKEVASKDKTTYKIVPRGCFAYNPSRINVGSVDYQRYEDKVIVSPLYNVFTVSDNLDKQYLYYYLKSGVALQRIRNVASGSVRDNLKLSMLYEFPINVRDIEEQRSIVYKLDQIRNIIDLRQQELEQLDELVKARFVELFGLPVSNSMNWETEKMQSIAPSQNYLGEMPTKVWLLNLDMVESQTGRIIEYLIVPKDEVGNSTCVFDDSTVLYSKLRPYLNKVVIPDRCGYATSELIPLKPNTSKINREYLAYMLRSDEFVSMISEKVAGAKMPRVSMGDFRNFDVPVPPKELQNEFANFVKQIDKSKFVGAICIDKIQSIKGELL